VKQGTRAQECPQSWGGLTSFQLFQEIWRLEVLGQRIVQSGNHLDKGETKMKKSKFELLEKREKKIVVVSKMGVNHGIVFF